MTTAANEPTDDEKLAAYADDLRVGLEAHTSGWLRGIIATSVDAESSDAMVDGLEGEVQRVLAEVADLLAADIDEQRANPLAVIRSLVPPLTAALRAAGVEPARRDPDAERLFPDDVFDLTPGAFSDIHPDLHLPGLAWGAAKAHVHLQRRRAEGLR